jgi:putative oxygen-independent coproporphyrinogen III oxidase
MGERGFGVYIHVPFCASRCGYCDFNTYTATELGGGADQANYAETVLAEVALAARVLDGAAPEVDTVFFGGGTPTLLPASDLARVLDGVHKAFGLAADAEVTTEANPESVTPASLAALRRAGFTRVSLGMQSARPHVLAVLDRRHTAGRPERAAAEAREAGFEHVNLDLIYGAPGETAEDWQTSLNAVIAAGVDHVSAYALIVEDGTRLGRQVARGEVPMPDDDVLADRYLQADAALGAAGMDWYEVSNWASAPGARCRHNELYWRSGDWWGFGPGAHSHVSGVRWWNVRHPTAYAERLAGGASPAHAREALDPETRRVEDVLLRLRLAEGLPLAVLDAVGVAAAARAVADGLLDPGQHAAGRAVLTLRGRLLADLVVRDLLG